MAGIRLRKIVLGETESPESPAGQGMARREGTVAEEGGRGTEEMGSGARVSTMVRRGVAGSQSSPESL